MQKQYIYEVARVRAKEVDLFSLQDIRALLSCPSLESCFSFLKDHSWGDDSCKTVEDFIDFQTNAVWDLVKELVPDEIVFDLFKLPHDYNNLKTAIKYLANDQEITHMFFEISTVNPDDILEAIELKNFEKLPEHMRETAKEARAALFETTDAQLCDSIIDKGLLNAMADLAKKSKNELCQEYVKIHTDIANIKIAVRGCRMKQSLSFFEKSLAKCGSLDVKRLAECASKSMDDICDYIYFTDYKDIISTLKESMAKFEVLCENLITTLMRKQKYNSFTVSPIFAYIYAKFNEIKNVRTILISKEGNISDEIIEERLRDTYV